MRMQSSAIRFICNRLKEGKKETEIYKLVKETFKLPSWYISSAIVKAKSLPEDKPVVFGGKGLFEKLCKNHLQGKQREKLKREWKERRQGSLISVGSKHKTHKGNLCMRFEQKEGSLYLRVAFVIGSLKYAPQLGIDKDIASAYVIGRRALGFKEEIPENYLKLLSDREYLEYAIYTYEEKEKELKEKLKKGSNQYKQKAIRSELKRVQTEKEMLFRKLQSLQSEPSSCKGANGRNSEQGLVKTSQSAWQVLKSALVLPLLEKFFVRDFSPLKSILVEGRWQRRASRLVPLEVGGTISRNTG